MRTIGVWLLVFLVKLIQAQVVFKKPHLLTSVQESVADNEAVPVYQLKNVPTNEYLRRQTARSSAIASEMGHRTGQYRFGKGFGAHIDSAEDGLWDEVEGLLRWRIRISSPGAKSLSVIFNRFVIPEGSEFYLVHGADILGPYTHLNVKQHKRFSTFPVEVNELTMLYLAPKDAPLPDIEISKIVHGFLEPFMTKSSGECNINTACSLGQSWRSEVKAVAMMLDSSGEGFCSGAMINNARNDGRQLFLTAHHCVGHRETDNNMLLFNYELKRCNSTSRIALPSRLATVHGLKRLAQWDDSDFALLEVEEQIPEKYDVFLAGWSAQNSGKAWQPVGIHHPSADVKKISRSLINATASCWGYCDYSSDFNHWEIDRWHEGTTEPGSSGSPLFESDRHLIIGQLHGGMAACENPGGYDRYGMLSWSFDKSTRRDEQLRPHLDPANDGVLEMDGAYLNDIRRHVKKSPRNDFTVQHI